MALELHYQSCFKSKDGNTYAVNLYEEGYEGNIVQLTPAENPLETREDDNNDVFTPVRSQSGYIRIIDTDNAIFDHIVPANNTSLFVRVYKGTYTGTWPNGVFTASNIEGSLVWQGFVQSQVYTQPWTEHESILELPVKSILGTLRTLYMPNGPMRIIPLREIVTLIVETLDISDLWTNLVFKTDWINTYNIFWNVYVMTAALQNQVTYISMINQKTVEYEGMSFYNILQSVAQLFGMTIRENGQTLYCEQLQVSGGLSAKKIAFSNFSQSNPTTEDTSFVNTALDSQFERTANMKSILQGARSVKISLSVDTKTLSPLFLPEAQEDQSEVTMIRVYDSSTAVTYKNLYIQAPERQANPYTVYETRLFNIWADGQFLPCPDYNQLGETITPISEGSTTNPIQVYDENFNLVWHTAVEKDATFYNNEDFIWHDGKWIYLEEYPSVDEQIRNTSIFKNPLSYVGFEPWTTTSGAYVDYPPNTTIWIRYGALPVRFHLASVNEEVKLKHGVYFNFDFENAKDLMRIKSPISYSYAGDYLNLNFTMHFLSTYHTGHQIQNALGDYEWVWDMDSWKVYKNSSNLTLYFLLKFGNKYWNGSSWQNSWCTFTLTFPSGKIPENYDPTMLVSDIGGYYIPIDDSLSGVIEFSWRGANSRTVPYSGVEYEPHAAIVEGFSCSLLRKNQIYVSSAEENNYFANVNERGFEDKKTINLILGTSCNNTNEAVNLIVDSNNIKIEQITYNDNSQQRPEQHLLEQMENYYSQVRHIYTAWLSTYVNGKDWFKTIITYEGRRYYGVIKKRLWKKAEEEIKLIETYNPNEE